MNKKPLLTKKKNIRESNSRILLETIDRLKKSDLNASQLRDLNALLEIMNVETSKSNELLTNLLNSYKEACSSLKTLHIKYIDAKFADLNSHQIH